MADCGKMHANLVRSAGDWADFNQAMFIKILKHGIVGAGGADSITASGSAVREGTHSGWIARISADSKIDNAGFWRMAMNHSQIRFTHSAIFEHISKDSMGVVSTRNNHDSRSILIQAMDDPRTINGTN